jgi:hypothetical protein
MDPQKQTKFVRQLWCRPRIRRTHWWIDGEGISIVLSCYMLSAENAWWVIYGLLLAIDCYLTTLFQHRSYRASNDIWRWLGSCLGKDLDRSGSVIFRGTIMPLMCRDWVKSRKASAGNLAGIRSQVPSENMSSALILHQHARWMFTSFCKLTDLTAVGPMFNLCRLYRTLSMGFLIK